MESKILDRARKLANRGAVATQRGSADVGPTMVGRLIVEMRAVDPSTGVKADWVKVVDDANLVVTNAQPLTALMAIGAANAPLNYIELGDPLVPTPPALADITLQQTTGQRKAAVLTTSGNVAQAEVLFLVGEANGFTFTEAGLFTGPFAAGGLYARKIFTGITKTVAFELRLRWHITYLVQTTGGDCTGIGIIGPGTLSSHTYSIAAGGEVAVAATFDFVPGANHLDVFLNGTRLAPGIHYNEASPPLNAPTLGPAASKGINLIAPIVLIALDKVLLVHRTIV
jgi:hypothetical protein